MRSVIIGLVLFIILPGLSLAQTDVSLYLKKGSSEQLEYVESKKGNLFKKLGHHGPAIENPWYGLRLYFDKKAAIDVYSKAQTRLELKEKQWYPSKKEQLAGWGADYYKVGNTVGLGGVKLWDNGQIIDLHPVTMRSARLGKIGNSAWMEMVSKGIPYKGNTVDVQVRVTVYANDRKARVEASSMNGEKLQFVSGINYFENLEVVKTDQYIATWGIHPEDVAAEKIKVGGAIFIPQGSNFEIQKMKDQYILISEPKQDIAIQIISASEREKEFKSMDDFIDLLEKSMEQ